MRAWLVARVPGFQVWVAACLGLLLASGLTTGITQLAEAAPQPTVSQVQAEINALTAKFNKVDEQYDQVATQLTAAKARLGQINQEVAADNKKFQAAREKVAQIAAAAFMDSGQTSLAGLLTTSDPSQVLSEASVVAQIAGARNEQTRLYLSTAQQLNSVQQDQRRTELGVGQLLGQLTATKKSIAKLLAQQKSELSSLTDAQQAAVQNGIIGGSSDSGTTNATYTGPTDTAAEKAVAFAYAQLGCAYVYGSTGPCSAGYDCSGLVQAAWSSAGISIPRDTYQQWAALPHVSSSDLQVGDLIYYSGIGHVAIYVGSGKIIDAPTAGRPVELLSMNTNWYADNFDGVAVP